jgi:hypothetical protein
MEKVPRNLLPKQSKFIVLNEKLVILMLIQLHKVKGMTKIRLL